MFSCPITGATVATDLTAERPDFEVATGNFLCTSCGLMHTWYRSEVWLEEHEASR